MKEFLYQKIVQPVMNQLKQGVDPATLSKSLIWGLLLGIFPLLGVTTALCLLVGTYFRFNNVAMQVTNYLAYPLQLLLLIPFYRLGEALFQVDPIALSIPGIMEEFQLSFLDALSKYAATGLRGVAVWALVAPIAYFLIYPLLLRILNLAKLRNK
jgi:uncharacterized protein (DUF2062 family)